MSTFIHLLVLFSIAVQSCSATMAAWWTQMGPQIIKQDPATGGFAYSVCNSKDTPIFPTNPSLMLSLSNDYTPKNNTPLTGTGWYTQGTTWASIFYQDINGDIINAVYTCDWDSGKFISKGFYVISSAQGAAKPHGNTGLASVLLGSAAGYHVFYHDSKKTVHQLTYSRDSNDGNWAYGGVVSRDPAYSNALACQFSTKLNMTLVYAKDDANIEVSRFNTDGNWHQMTFPRPLVGFWNQTSNATNLTTFSLDTTSNINFTLPAWTGKTKSLGFAIDAQYTRSVFYIGTDRKLYQASNINYVWQLRNNQTDAAWPLADDAESELAVASDFDSSALRVYYTVKGALTEAKYEMQGNSGVWRNAAALPTVTPPASADAPPTTSTAAAADAAGGAGLSDGARAGIGVGVTLGVFALAGVGVVLFVVRRGRARRDAEAHAVAEEEARALETTQQYAPSSHYDYAHTPYGSPPPSSVSPFSAPGWPVDRKDGYVPQELGAPRQVFEMPQQEYSHELLGEGHVREMQ